jgi:hypothetical protein
MTDEQIKHMVGRFLNWKLPVNFRPDGGISFKAAFNEHTAHPMKHEPVGTNLFDATQADAMIRYMIDGLPSLSEGMPKAEWYLDADDPADGHSEICDVMLGHRYNVPVEIQHAAVVAVTWHAKLLPADDADSDDEWECEANTEADCLRLIADELDRRARAPLEDRQ